MRSNLHRTVVRRGLSCSCQGLSVKGDRVKIERRESFFKLPYLPYSILNFTPFLSILLATIKGETSGNGKINRMLKTLPGAASNPGRYRPNREPTETRER